MIARNTVLVLGAGASRPYGFPVGVDLVDQIHTELLQPVSNLLTADELLAGGKQPSFRERLQALGHDAKSVTDFANNLRSARPYSIDAFLETRAEFRKVGKAAIADVLLRAETSNGVATANRDADWYRYLLNRFLLMRSQQFFTEQARRLTIITFNFDRSFEWVLFSAIQAVFGVDAAAARQLTTEIAIHHIHGVLGEPAFLVGGQTETTTAYGVNQAELAASVRIAAPQIRVVDEEIEQAVVEDAKAALLNAVFVYFIGFGYDERNLAKLHAPDSLRRASVIRGTAYELTTTEQAPITRCFAGLQIHLDAEDALTFLRTHAEALFE